MPIPIRSPAEIDQMRRAGVVLRKILELAREACVPGVTTRSIDAMVRRWIAEAGAEPAAEAVGARGEPFPGVCSISVNEEAVHGVPGPRIIRAGDVVTVDAAVRFAGWCADAAVAIAMPAADPDSVRLVGAARTAAAAVARAMLPGRRWSELAPIAADTAARHGCSVVEGWSGHGIGRDPHERPALPPVPAAAEDFTLRPGMVLAVEPILCLGNPATVELDDGFTVCTADRSWACHEEHTVAISRAGPVVLTAP